jgi:hypothetical protein
MLAVWMMQMAAHQIIRVVAMRDTLVAAVRAVNVTGVMLAAAVLRCAFLPVGATVRERVFINVVIVYVMQVSVMEVVRVAVVPHGSVSAIRTVDMRMRFMLGTTSGHNIPLRA